MFLKYCVMLKGRLPDNQWRAQVVIASLFFLILERSECFVGMVSY